MFQGVTLFAVGFSFFGCSLLVLMIELTLGLPAAASAVTGSAVAPASPLSDVEFGSLSNSNISGNGAKLAAARVSQAEESDAALQQLRQQQLTAAMNDDRVTEQAEGETTSAAADKANADLWSNPRRKKSYTANAVRLVISLRIYLYAELIRDCG